MGIPTNTTTYGDISPRTAGAIKAKLLERGQHLMVVERFGQVDPLQKNKTKSCKWRRYNSFPRAIQPLAEGVPPTGNKLTYVDIIATLEQFGDAYPLTDVVLDTHEDPVLQETVKIAAADRFFVHDPDGNRIEILQWQRPYTPDIDGRFRA